MGLWLATGVFVCRDWLTNGNADWVPFAAFTGLIILIALPTIFGKSDA